MPDKIDRGEIESRSNLLRKTAEELKMMSEDFPALFRNTSRILASIRMLELNMGSDLHSTHYL
jgi:hypothetical protein